MDQIWHIRSQFSNPPIDISAIYNQFKNTSTSPKSKNNFACYSYLGNTIDKVYIFCKCKNKDSWCLIQKYACFKLEVKCGIVCHRREENGKTDYSNIATPTFRLQTKLQVKDKKKEKELTKR